MHRPSSVELIPFSEARGLVIGAAAFLLSIVGAGFFLLRVDLTAAQWLRELIARAALDTSAERTALGENGKAEVALAEDDLPGVVAALKEGQRSLQEARGRGSIPLPPSFTGAERVSLAACVGGFALGILSAVGDFVAKMPR